jgi:hypothetical protein
LEQEKERARSIADDEVVGALEDAESEQDLALALACFVEMHSLPHVAVSTWSDAEMADRWYRKVCLPWDGCFIGSLQTRGSCVPVIRAYRATFLWPRPRSVAFVEGIMSDLAKALDCVVADLYFPPKGELLEDFSWLLDMATRGSSLFHGGIPCSIGGLDKWEALQADLDRTLFRVVDGFLGELQDPAVVAAGVAACLRRRRQSVLSTSVGAPLLNFDGDDEWGPDGHDPDK